MCCILLRKKLIYFIANFVICLDFASVCHLLGVASFPWTYLCTDYILWFSAHVLVCTCVPSGEGGVDTDEGTDISDVDEKEVDANDAKQLKKKKQVLTHTHCSTGNIALLWVRCEWWTGGGSVVLHVGMRGCVNKTVHVVSAHLLLCVIFLQYYSCFV